AAGLPLRLPQVSGERRVKLSAAWLIEHSGISKGFRLPGSGAAISSKHTLAITNRGSATAADVAQLARYVVQRVQSEFGVILVPEPNLYGLEL
ncbi:MAG: UDP-N-acetylenolpyruvoylglucosamine reductase, partial [Actinobacteria bacterium]|nr:UDP-N-acetylenolpyruvoylglucosamine reductase [Actinomycetota bacterium]